MPRCGPARIHLIPIKTMIETASLSGILISEIIRALTAGRLQNCLWEANSN